MFKKELVSLYQSLHQVGSLRGVKFGYAVAKNIAMITPEIEALDKAHAPKEEFNIFENERVELAKKFAIKDEQGKPKIIPLKEDPRYQEFVIEDKEGFEKELKVIQEKYKEAIEDRKKQTEEYKKLLDEEIVIIFHKVLITDLPEDISVDQTKSIFPIIAE